MKFEFTFDEFKQLEFKRYYLLILGVIGGFTGAFYFLDGFNIWVFSFWLSSLIICGLYFFFKDSPGKNFGLTIKDGYILIFLLFIFAPIYLFSIYTVPFQINSDEIAIMITMKKLTEPKLPDLFALSHYFHFPALIFIILGWIGKLFGGINLFNMRLVHALSGLSIIALSFIFFRIFSSYFWAATGAFIIGINHSLIAISRMAMRDNSALLIEIISLILLFGGLLYRSQSLSFIGGIATGLTFYVYYSARIVIISPTFNIYAH